MQFLVDPVLLTVPGDNATSDDIVSFVEHLYEWNEVISSQEHSFFVSEAYISALSELGRFPEYHTLRELWFKADLDYINAKTVYSACHTIINNLPYFEERAELAGLVEVYRDQVNVTPDLVRRLEEPVAGAFRETLGCLAYAREELKPAIVDELYLITHPIEQSSVAHVEAMAETSVGQISLETEFPLITSPTHIASVQGLQNVWQNHSMVLQTMCADLAQRHQLPVLPIPASHIFAMDFNQSVERYGFHNRPDYLIHIYEKIAALVYGLIPPQSTRRNHELRDVTVNDFDVQGRRWDAWRLWVTCGKPAIRLHYWKHEGKYIISRVVVHEDFTIGPVPPDCPL